MPNFEEGIDPETQPPTPRRTRGPNKPKPAPEPKGRKRRSSSQSKVALALVATHLKGVYSQMALLQKAVDELQDALE